MKIASILDNNISAGGGFNQALNAITRLIAITKGSHQVVVYTSVPENLSYLNELGIVAKVYKLGFLDKVILGLSSSYLWRRLQNNLKMMGNLEKKLIKDQVDIVYFTTPSLRCLCLQKLNYISTVWDLSHRDTPEFPEVRSFGEFLIRESQFQSTLSQSVLILCDSQQLLESINLRYGIEKGRMVSMPFMPGPFLSEKFSRNKNEVLKKYSLEAGYFYYPAQFWAHKNHIRLIKALSILNKKGNNYQIVFSGSDKGNLKNIKQAAKYFNVESNVHFLGFVDAEDIRGLYQGSSAILMPSYFGPTNLPPLEAWTLGVPLIQSSLFNAQAKNAALYANPDSDIDWSEKMEMVLNKDFALELVENGRKRLFDIDRERMLSEDAFLKVLNQFEKRSESWKEWSVF